MGVPAAVREAGFSRQGWRGGRFEFSLSEVRELHRQFAAETDAFEKMVEKQSRASLSLIPLADDPASRKHHKAALEHSAKVSKAINEQYKFAKGFRDAMGAAIGIKAEGEDATSNAMRGIGGNVA